MRVQKGSPATGDNCYCVLPGNVHYSYLRRVLRRLMPTGSDSAGIAFHNHGMGHLLVICAEYDFTGHYHFESERFDRGGRLFVLGPRHKGQFLIAMGVGLVDFFGGVMVASDKDDVPIREVARRSDPENCPLTQNELDAFEVRLAALDRISDVEAATYSYLCGP